MKGAKERNEPCACILSIPGMLIVFFDKKSFKMYVLKCM